MHIMQHTLRTCLAILLPPALLLAGCQTVKEQGPASLSPQDALGVAKKAVPPGVKVAAGLA